MNNSRSHSGCEALSLDRLQYGLHPHLQKEALSLGNSLLHSSSRLFPLCILLRSCLPPGPRFRHARGPAAAWGESSLWSSPMRSRGRVTSTRTSSRPNNHQRHRGSRSGSRQQRRSWRRLRSRGSNNCPCSRRRGVAVSEEGVSLWSGKEEEAVGALDLRWGGLLEQPPSFDSNRRSGRGRLVEGGRDSPRASRRAGPRWICSR